MVGGMTNTATRQPTRTDLVDANVRAAADLRQNAVAGRTAARAFNDFADVIGPLPTTSAIADEVQAHLVKYARSQAQSLTARALVQDRQADDLDGAA